ncbi:YciI family protein [Nocardioides sp.]|uniref:YciI family protein n=1 Tax=Nocardioides sp. TaxID=35761 RepID=UPI002ED5483B
MTDYMIMLPGDEATWQAADEATRTAMYARHTDFQRALQERGHTMTGGAELAHSSTARTLRTTNGTVSVTDGPYAETVEQLTGFYLVRSDDLEDLLDVCRALSNGDGGIEVRACVAPG